MCFNLRKLGFLLELEQIRQDTINYSVLSLLYSLFLSFFILFHPIAALATESDQNDKNILNLSSFCRKSLLTHAVTQGLVDLLFSAKSSSSQISINKLPQIQPPVIVPWMDYSKGHGLSIDINPFNTDLSEKPSVKPTAPQILCDAKYSQNNYSYLDIIPGQPQNIFVGMIHLEEQDIDQDTHWYSDDEINALLEHYIGEKLGSGLMHAINLDQNAGATLQENLEARERQLRQLEEQIGLRTPTIVLPINLGRFNPSGGESTGNHWAALFIHHPEQTAEGSSSVSTDTPIITYIDPFGRPIPEQLQRILDRHYSEAEIVNPSIRFQYDGYNCGPWIIEILRCLVATDGREVTPELFNINSARIEHLECLNTLSISTPATMHFVPSAKECTEGATSSDVVSPSPIEEQASESIVTEDEEDIALVDSMIKASQEGDLEKIKHLFKKGVRLDIADDYGMTVLMYASECDYFDIVRFLQEHGADINQVDNEGWTALMYASQRGNLDVIRFLQEHGTDINATDDIGWTALMYASLNGHLDVVRFLQEQGADVHTTDKKGRAVFMWVCRNGHLDVVRFMQEQGADINSVMRGFFGGMTALMHASKNGHLDVVRFLQEQGADVNAIDQYGRTALMEASRNGHLDVVRFLQEQGADINAINEIGWSALMDASYTGHLDVIKFLQEHGADLNVVNSIGKTALMIATLEEHLEIVKFLITSGAGINRTIPCGFADILRYAYQHGCTKVIRFLIANETYVDVTDDATDTEGNTLLMLAARNEGETALNIALRNNRSEVAEFLRNHGAK